MLPDEIIHSKLEYMELLFEHPEGLTTTDIVENYFDDVDQKAVSMALKRLVYQNSATRIRTSGVPFGYTYFINDYGIRKMYFLQEREALESEFEDEPESETLEDLEEEIRMLEQERADL